MYALRMSGPSGRGSGAARCTLGTPCRFLSSGAAHSADVPCSAIVREKVLPLQHQLGLRS